MCFPDPRTLLAIDVEMGGIMVEGISGDLIGCFYWYRDAQGEIIVPLYECTTNTLLEEIELYERALEFKPALRTLISEYKIGAAKYVLCSNKLLLRITRDTKRAILSLLASIAENVHSAAFVSAMPQTEFLELDYTRNGQRRSMYIRRSFFETAYREVISKIGKYPFEAEGTYEIIESDVLNKFADLQFNYITVASGPRADLNSIVDAHRNTISYFTERNNRLGNDICRCYYRLLNIREKFSLELR
jgi:hypothetical protein